MVVLAAGAALLVSLVLMGQLMWRVGYREESLGWTWDHCPSPPGLCVAAVEADGPATGQLAAGDRILGLGGRARLSEAALLALPAGEPYTLLVEREGERLGATLEPVLRDRPGGRRKAISFLVGSSVFCALGLLMGLLRPGQRVVQLAAGFCVTQSAMYLAVGALPLQASMSGWLILLLALLRSNYPLNMLLAYSTARRFPSGLPEDRPRFRFEGLLYAAGAILYLAIGWRYRVFFRGVPDVLPAGYDHRLFEAILQPAYFGFFIFLGVAACVAVARNYRRLEGPGERRRIRWVLYGALVAIGPQSALLVLRPLLVPDTFSFWYDVSRLATVALPIATAFAILKYRLFDIRLVIRRGVQYLLARNTLRVLLLLPVAAMAVTVLRSPERPVGELVLRNPVFLALLAAAALGLAFRARLMAAIDRRFFRSMVDGERLLLDLIDDLHELPSLPVVCQRVAGTLGGALHPRGVRIFLRDGPALRLLHSSEADAGGADPGPRAGLDSELTLTRSEEIPDHFELLRTARTEPAARTPRELAADRLPAEELQWLEDRQVELVVPVLSGQGELSGLFLLGEKASEELYTPEDRRLLQALARETGVRHETLALRRRVEQDRRERTEVLARLEGKAEAVLRECPACGRCYDANADTCLEDGSELVLSLPVERTVRERYRLERLLGKGGMGAVYEGTDLRLGRQVAVKLLLGGRFGDPEALGRFDREARAAARLSHPHILTVFDYGPLPHGGAYLVSELLVGKTLREEILVGGPVPPERAADWIDQLLDGLDAAHRAGVVHRDLKPENALLAAVGGAAPVLKILDFGLAKLTLPDPADATSLSLPGMVMGTLRYMSPEQLVGAAVDQRTDLFSVAILAIEMLTARHPFESVQGPELVGAILYGEIRFPGKSAAAGALDAVLQRALAKDAERRTSSVQELRSALVPAIRALAPRDAGSTAG